MVVLALIDESVIEVTRGQVYVIACALVVDSDSLADQRSRRLRQSVGGIVSDRSRPFRWSKEGVNKKSMMLDLAVSEGLFVAAAVGSPRSRRLQRAGRAECLIAVCELLAREGVTGVVIESRQMQDEDDVETLHRATKQGRLPHAFPEPEFHGKEEQLLWLPDAVAGAVREAETGSETKWLEKLVANDAILDVIRP